MDIILIPGLWLDASSWDEVVPRLEAAGHTAHPLTLPGVGSPAAEAAQIGMREWVASVVAAIDRIDGPVVVVGHSGGGNVAWGAVDARADRVARVVFVDTAPPPPGFPVSEFAVVDGVVPFPGWAAFDEPDIADLDEEVRARVVARALSVPPRSTSDGIELTDPRRYDVPATMLSGQLDEAGVQEMFTQWPAFGAEYTTIRDREVIRLGSGHWPQFSQPQRLADEIVAAASR